LTIADIATTRSQHGVLEGSTGAMSDPATEVARAWLAERGWEGAPLAEGCATYEVSRSAAQSCAADLVSVDVTCTGFSVEEVDAAEPEPEPENDVAHTAMAEVTATTTDPRPAGGSGAWCTEAAELLRRSR
jgi:hypothetical protein